MARPRNTVPLEQRDYLTVPDAMKLLRQKGRPLSRLTITRAIGKGRLHAHVDDLCHDRYGQPLLRIRRKDLDAWLSATLPALKIPA
jgi:hypothetical protein